jgi:hypothetical protein
MATKKKAKPARKRSAAPRRRASRPAAAPAETRTETAPAMEESQGSNNGVLALLVIGLASIIWLLWHGHSQQKVDAPAAAQPSASAPAARSVAPKAAPTAAPKAQAAPTRRATAGAEKELGEPTLTLDRSEEKPMPFRCWRAEGGTAQLEVFGPRNRRVRTVKSDAGAAGWVPLDFDGKDDKGKKLPVGLYFVRPSSQDEQRVMDVWVKG